MSFKNAFRILLGKFRYVWSILIYVAVMLVILFSVGLTFLKPVFNAFADAGVWKKVTELFSIVMDGATLSQIFAVFGDIFSIVKTVLSTDVKAFWSSFLFVVLVATFLYRFIMGLSELPLVSIIEGVMTDNAKYGFAGRYVSMLGKSSVFSLVKMLFMTVYDAFMYFIFYGAIKAFNNVSIFLVPFGGMVVLVALLSFRYTLISGWTAYMIIEKKGIFSAFASSIRFAFKNFGSLFSTWVISWFLFIAINMLVAIFTFGAGLLVSIPACVYLVSLLNMTQYYGKNHRNYYVDGAIFNS